MSGVNTSCKTNEISSHPLGKKKNKYEMLARKKISPSDSPKSYSMFLSPITVQESYLTGFLTTLPHLVVVTVTAGTLVETPEAGTETMSLDLVARTLVDSG